MKKTKKAIAAACGAVIGLIGGFFGGGGGMAAVPLLSGYLKLETKRAHATTMLIILPMSVFAALTYYLKGTFDFSNTAVTGGGVILGGIVGALLLKKLNSSLVTLIFSLLMIAAGLKMIF